MRLKALQNTLKSGSDQDHSTIVHSFRHKLVLKSFNNHPFGSSKALQVFRLAGSSESPSS